MDELKEKVLVFEEKEEKTYKDKKFWELLTDGGGKFSCWDKPMVDAVVIGEETKVKYEIKKTEKYTNLTIKAVSVKKDDGTWGEWIEGAKGKGGFKAFDSEGANKRTCLQAAATIVAAQVAKGAVTDPITATLMATSKLMAGVFGVAKVATPVATPPKKATVVEAESDAQEEEAVAF